MTTEYRPYQGYPYVNPLVIDVPSLDPETAAKWNNLPRRHIGVPAASGTSDRPGPSRENVRTDSNTNADVTEAESSKPNKNRSDHNPVVYIDLPDSCASSVLECPRGTIRQTEESFVQDTILYDPFKDRRIELQVADDDSEDESAVSRSPVGNEQSFRPLPPNTLQIPPSSSSGYSTSPAFGSSASSSVPVFMSKEAGYYGRQPTPDDGFPLSPIPVSEFPEPPPAYTETDNINRPNYSQAPPPPRTEVVTTVADSDPTSTIRPGSDRKLLQCQHCGQRVHSLVVRESGVFTHILAVILSFMCLIPVVILIYCTDGCKYKNHYCPNCNQLIGYEIPILCQQMALV